MKKIAIVGWSSTRKYAPYKDNSWEIWILNQRIELFPRYDLHFELHNTLHYPECEYVDLLKRDGKKSIVTGIDPRFTDAAVFPKDIMIEKYGDFFTSTMSWMIVYAIEQGATDIGVWGVDCLDKEEYIQQRPSILYLLGIAKGKGIKLHFPENCKLFRKIKLYWNL